MQQETPLDRRLTGKHTVGNCPQQYPLPHAAVASTRHVLTFEFSAVLALHHDHCVRRRECRRWHAEIVHYGCQRLVVCNRKTAGHHLCGQGASPTRGGGVAGGVGGGGGIGVGRSGDGSILSLFITDGSTPSEALVKFFTPKFDFFYWKHILNILTHLVAMLPKCRYPTMRAASTRWRGRAVGIGWPLALAVGYRSSIPGREGIGTSKNN